MKKKIKEIKRGRRRRKTDDAGKKIGQKKGRIGLREES